MQNFKFLNWLWLYDHMWKTIFEKSFFAHFSPNISFTRKITIFCDPLQGLHNFYYIFRNYNYEKYLQTVFHLFFEYNCDITINWVFQKLSFRLFLLGKVGKELCKFQDSFCKNCLFRFSLISSLIATLRGIGRFFVNTCEKSLQVRTNIGLADTLILTSCDTSKIIYGNHVYS